MVAEADLPKIPKNVQGRLAHAIERRLATDPAAYGAPLRGSLRGYSKLRVGDYRIMFKIVGNKVQILAILHRKHVYETAARRIE